MLNQTRLKELLHYSPDSGLFTWLVSRRKHKANRIAGWKCDTGYIKIGIDGKEYRAHRLAWLYMHGVWPEYIDHINGIRDDNREINIRSVEYIKNCMNMGLGKNNTHGIKGIYLNKKSKMWICEIYNNKEKVRLGRSKSFFEACCIRKAAEHKYGFHPNHGRII